MKQKSKLEPTERGRKANPRTNRRNYGGLLSGEDFEESPLDGAQLLGNEKEKRKYLLLTGHQ